MYLVGTFDRSDSSFSNDNPMSLVGLREEITKEHLQRAVQDSSYQVIDLIKREYFDPKGNKWVKIQNF